MKFQQSIKDDFIGSQSFGYSVKNATSYKDNKTMSISLRDAILNRDVQRQGMKLGAPYVTNLTQPMVRQARAVLQQPVAS